MGAERAGGRPRSWISDIKGRLKHMCDRQSLAEWLGNPFLYAGPFPGIGMCVVFSGRHRPAGTGGTGAARSRRRYSVDAAASDAAAAVQPDVRWLAHRGDDMDDGATLLEK